MKYYELVPVWLSCSIDILQPKASYSTTQTSYSHKSDNRIWTLEEPTKNAGPQLLLATTCQTFWITGAGDLLRILLCQHVTCWRHGAENVQQIIGSILTDRISPKRAFLSIKVDYAGPVPLKIGWGCGSRNEKAWIALFVCLTVKAMHLELVSSLHLETEAFLAALKRFISHRGKPNATHNDNRTNFVGASKEWHCLFLLERHNELVKTSSQQDQIEWHFIPQPRSYFRGLWEAGIKSVKYNLRIVVSLMVEKLSTVLFKIKACLNILTTYSNVVRPVRPISTNSWTFSYWHTSQQITETWCEQDEQIATPPTTTSTFFGNGGLKNII